MTDIWCDIITCKHNDYKDTDKLNLYGLCQMDEININVGGECEDDTTI
jgi:hypothetical protein